MKFILLFLVVWETAIAQKPPLNMETFKNWPSVGTEAITNDGNYVSYHIYNQHAGSNTLVIQSANNDWKKEFTGASSESFTDDSKQVFFKTANDSNCILTLGGDDIHYIYSNQKPFNSIMSADSNQYAYITENKNNGQSVNELWYFKKGMNVAIKLLDDHSPDIGIGMKLSNQPPEVSKDGKRIFFSLQEIDTVKQKPDAVQVDIWSYTDKTIQPLQLAATKTDPVYLAVINLSDNKVIRLEEPEETVISRCDSFVLLSHGLGNGLLAESNWNVLARPSYYLLSFIDGSRKLIVDNIVYPDEGVGMSPRGKWLIYFDFKQDNYFSYEVATGIKRNITKTCDATWLVKENDRPEPVLYWKPWIDTWLANDESVFIYDNYDIWQIDPSGNKAPVCLTNYYGRKHNIKFGFLNEGKELRDFIEENKSFTLIAIDIVNKNRGFYTETMGTSGNPDSCIMGPFVFNDWLDGTFYGEPLKAKNANTWLVRRMSATDAPNFFITKNFRQFIQITNIQPQKNYNWLTTELMRWKDFDGNILTGILYKPEDFDPSKKYPVIFNYYEQRSDELNLYLYPGASFDNINIPWFVSHDYLVFVPDIHYKAKAPGQSAYNSIVSAAIYLSKKPWVNRKKMGLQGHSFGGYETDYVVSHTNIFAAACSASGTSDLISFYGSADRTPYPTQWSEQGQGRMMNSPWQSQAQYIRNSPIFSADKVATPLLMMNNKNDKNVPFGQGVEFFTALRRLGRKVWMLQYDDGGHSLDRRSSSASDYTIRLTQFFDYYLKGTPAPKWMVEGIPVKMKGIDDGLELMPAGINPRPGLNVAPLKK